MVRLFNDISVDFYEVSFLVEEVKSNVSKLGLLLFPMSRRETITWQTHLYVKGVV